MVKNLTKHGNSYALIIEKPIMELLNIEPETPLEITTVAISVDSTRRDGTAGKV